LLGLKFLSPTNGLNREKEVDSSPQCSHSVLVTDTTLNEADTLALVSQLRELCAKLARQWAVSEIELHRVLRDFAQPELSAPARSYQFKVEQWDKTEDHIIWLIAVSNNFLVARAAYSSRLVK
jgi:hypothetical protein